MDQTGVRLLAISNEKTYTLKGSRDVVVCGRDDKRAVTAVGSKQAMIQDGWKKCGLGDISNQQLQAEAVLLNCSWELFEDRIAASTSEPVIEPQTEAFNELPMEIDWNAASYESLVSQAIEDLQVNTPFEAFDAQKLREFLEFSG
ncbi:hypothetical protein R1sor_016447 [Riccia sorocarpa]|uniref:Uncharacterized protein n=1 Tax=Riccia sorocarpa TaxID=122646 RepID=A0ABD3HEZ8_9MARC